MTISNDVLGSVIGGRYRIEAQIGRGGMATVYRAHDESLGRTVALKVLQGHPTDAAAAQRERSEVEVLASLSHPALVTLFDAAEYDVDGEQRTCLVMEFVDGPTLEARIAQRPLARADIVAMATDLAEALDVVHSRGVVHRDIKPANILLGTSRLPGRDHAAKLADFGIAYLIDSTRITEVGTLIGTAAYLSPEQARGTAPGSSSDIYSLGLVLLEALTGVREFTGSMVESVSARLARDPVVPDSLGAGWAELLRSMTLRDPASRPTAAAVAASARRLGAEGTAVMPDQTVALDEATQPFSATRTMDNAAPTATSVMPSAATEVLHEATADVSAAPVSKRWSPRRWLIVWFAAAIFITLVLLAALVIPTLTDSPEPEQAVPTLPAVDGELGEHLGDLLESVTP